MEKINYDRTDRVFRPYREVKRSHIWVVFLQMSCHKNFKGLKNPNLRDFHRKYKVGGFVSNGKNGKKTLNLHRKQRLNNEK